jgi:hypothetical protein
VLLLVWTQFSHFIALHPSVLFVHLSRRCRRGRGTELIITYGHNFVSYTAKCSQNQKKKPFLKVNLKSTELKLTWKCKKLAWSLYVTSVIKLNKILKFIYCHALFINDFSPPFHYDFFRAVSTHFQNTILDNFN